MRFPPSVGGDQAAKGVVAFNSESWTECSCLNHGDAAPPVNQSVIPILSTLANQGKQVDQRLGGNVS